MIDVSALLTWLVSAGYGVLSAVIPIANAEAYVAAARALGVRHGLLIATAVATGQTGGKAALFLGVRHGKKLPVVTNRASRRDKKRGRFKAMADRLLQLTDSPWGIPVTLLGSIVGIPSIYALALIAGASRMRFPLFCAAVLIGRVVRFGLVAMGVQIGVTLLWHLVS